MNAPLNRLDRQSTMKQNPLSPSLQSAKRGRKKATLTASARSVLGEQEAIAKATWLYHHRKFTQEEVAQELGLSRTIVMRLLREATEQGLVTLSLRVDVLQRLEASVRIAQHFGLKEVFLVPTAKTDTDIDVLRALGKAGAMYLQASLKPDQILTISWSQTLLEVARALDYQPVSGLVVAQSFGGLNGGILFNPSQVTSLFADKLHARAYHLYVPALVATQEVHDILLADPGLREALEVARQASLSMVGIGVVAPNAAMIQTGFLDLAAMHRLKAKGAVGDISGRYFDVQGNRVAGDIDERIMGLSWEDLRQLQNVVGVAGGPEKTEAILGALRTGLLDYLITDDETAMRLLRRIEDPAAGVEPSR
jgi:DNA-binding transcriptional regulator LsrR (DeoR family)